MTLRSTLRTLQHHWLTVSFLLGFITDVILLNKIDDVVDNLILLFYVLLSTTALLIFYTGIAEKGPAFLARFFRRAGPIAMQYAFGGLLSGMLIFYGRSGDWLASAPFFVLILSVIFANEFLDKRSDRLVYQIVMYFIGLFSYVVLVMPVITGYMGDAMFILSGLIALGVVTFVIQTLCRIIPNFMLANLRRMIFAVGSIYVTFNVLYFSSLIPPIPLSLTELQIVHSVSSSVSDSGQKVYRIVTEEQPWYRQLPFITPIIHPTSDAIACYASVYAPTNLSTEIFHRWEYKNERGEWQEQFRLGYDIAGSSVGGYRGYTRTQNFFSGTWRCSVETERGQVLGRKVFVIDTQEEPKRLETQLR